MPNELQKRLITPDQRVHIPVTHHPLYRVEMAIQNGVHRNILLSTWGGLGDQICAEPTLRYTLNRFKNCEISLASYQPELFRHLKFKRVFDMNVERPIEEKYLILQTITPPDDSNMVWLFFSHMLTHCVDFASMCALRMQLPNADKEIFLQPEEPKNPILHEIITDKKNHVLIHAGKHWETKTFPVDWWQSVYNEVVKRGAVPVLIGKDTTENVGFVEIEHDPSVGIDLRNECSVNDSVWLCKNASWLICSDSAPLHMAASGNAHIAYIASVKHPDYITHWRHGQFGWGMKNFSKGGMWDIVDHLPNKGEQINVDKCPPDFIRSILPDPKEILDWIETKGLI